MSTLVPKGADSTPSLTLRVTAKLSSAVPRDSYLACFPPSPFSISFHFFLFQVSFDELFPLFATICGLAIFLYYVF